MYWSDFTGYVIVFVVLVFAFAFPPIAVSFLFISL